MEFVMITDTHFMNSSRVRTGDVLEDLATKLEFVRDYCNEHNCILLHGGDMFNTPSVPDTVKNRLFPIFASFNNDVYAIPGNHDELYNSYDHINKTSYQTLVSSGLIKDLYNKTIDLGECILTSQKPLITRGKPQICLYHGFLNQDDGNWTFYFQDINTQDPTYILLGHDHVVYDPLQFLPNVKIIRPGSFHRQTRQAEHLRQPVLVHIRIKDGKLQFKRVEIATARPFSEIFTAKETNITKAQQHDSYEDIIKQIRDARVGEMTFTQALQQVAPETIVDYATKLLTQYRMDSSIKRQNL